MLKGANLSPDTEKLARVTIKTLTYKDMSTQLKTIFGDQQTISCNISKDMQGILKLPSEVKTEPTYFETKEGQEDLYYGDSWRGYSSGTQEQKQEAYQGGSRRGYSSRSRGGVKRRSFSDYRPRFNE